MKNKTIKQNQFNPKNKTKKSYVASGGKMSLFSSSKVYETPFHKPDEGDNLNDLKVILNGFYYGYKYTQDINDSDTDEPEGGLSNELKQTIDVAIITKIDDAYEINYLASEQEISGQIIISQSPSDPPITRKFQVINEPNDTEQLDTFKHGIQHVYNGFKAPKKENPTGFFKRVKKRVKKSKFVKVEARENIEIAIIHKEDDAYKIEFLKENPYEEGNKNEAVLNHWEFILNE